MILKTLTLQNFLSYREASIDFTGLRLACLCGQNGAGKSSLIDALTWSLYGEARSGRGADELVRLGETQLSVTLTFALNGHTYRVIRKRAVGKSGQSDLRLQMQAKTEAWKDIGGNGIRESQAAILALLKCDFRVFTSSVVFVQGQADTFTRATPTERKEVLAQILNLDEYKALAERAKAHVAQCQQRLVALEYAVAELRRQYEVLPRHEERLVAKEQEYAAAQEALAGTQAELRTALAAQAAGAEQRKRQAELAARQQRLTHEIETLTTECHGVRSQIAAYRSKIALAAVIQKDASEHRTLSCTRDAYAGQQIQLRKLEAEQAKLKLALQVAVAQHQSNLRLAEAELLRTEQVAAKLPALKAQGFALRNEVAALDTLAQERETAQERLQAANGNRAIANLESIRLTRELGTLTARMGSLLAAGAECPTCGAIMSPEHAERHQLELQQEKAVLEGQLQEQQQRHQAAEADFATRARRIGQLDVALAKGQPQREKLATCYAEYRLAETATNQVGALQEQVARFRQVLAQPDLATETDLRSVAAQIFALGYSEAAHLACQTRLTALASAERELLALETATRELPSVDARLEALNGQIAARTQERSTVTEDLNQANSGDHYDWESEVARLQVAQRGNEQLVSEVAQELGAAKQAVAQCQALGPQQQAQQRERDTVAAEQAEWEELQRAFGRNGIQALIIENALPAIETVANELLEKMGGQLTIRLPMQKENKTGGVAETLEIVIADALGERPYTQYSGGEQMRINLALRVALSRLLTSRAACRLECLFVDEALSPLDAEALARVMDAFNVIAAEFQQVLVITHDESLKDAFPNQMFVTKDAVRGSTVVIS